MKRNTMNDFQRAQRKPVTIRGVTFMSQADAARHFGLKKHTVCAAIARGKQDNIGLGTGYKGKKDATGWWRGSSQGQQAGDNTRRDIRQQRRGVTGA